MFPGGNLSAFHEASIPEPDSPERHRDGEAYRLAAIRETFEESGILLARKAVGNTTDLLELSDEAREAGRKAVHGNSVRFVDWLRDMGGIPDTGMLKSSVPGTERWAVPLLTKHLTRRSNSLHTLGHADHYAQALYHPDVPLYAAARHIPG